MQIQATLRICASTTFATGLARCNAGRAITIRKRRVPAITAVAAGQRYLDVTLAQKLALGELEHAGKSAVEQLSEREFEVFVRLAGGSSVQRIAEDLKLSTSTVGTHLYNIKQKLGVSNQAELTLIAIRLGLIEA